VSRRPKGFTKTNGVLGKTCGHGGYRCDYCEHRYCGAMLVAHRSDCTAEIPRDTPSVNAEHVDDNLDVPPA